EGHCRVPRSYKTEDGYWLGQWVGIQRYDDKLEPVRRQRLEALPGWSWNTLEDKWEVGFSQLRKFFERQGHCRVPALYNTDDGYRRGRWVSTQRRGKDRMEPARRQRLEALPGWVWKVEKSLPQAAAAQVEKSLPQAAAAQEKRE